MSSSTQAPKLEADRTLIATVEDRADDRMILPAIAALVAVTLIALGSLTPFAIAGTAPAAWRLGDLAWHRLTMADALANFAVYLPIGALLFAWWRRGLGAAVAVISATVAAGGLSLVLESTQATIATRYASWYDLLFNAFGALTGAVLAALLVSTVAYVWRAVVHVAAAPWWRKVMCIPVLLCLWLVLAAATAADGVRGMAAVARETAMLHGTTVPLVDYFYQPLAPVAVWLAELAVVYAALVWTCAAVWSRLRGRAGGLRWSVLWLTLAAAVVGIVEVNGRWSVSDAIVAGGAVLIAVAAYRDLSRQRAAEVGVLATQRAAARRLEQTRQQAANAIARRRAFGSRAVNAGLAGCTRVAHRKSHVKGRRS